MGHPWITHGSPIHGRIVLAAGPSIWISHGFTVLADIPIDRSSTRFLCMGLERCTLLGNPHGFGGSPGERPCLSIPWGTREYLIY